MPDTIPLFPLSEVLFPGMPLPLHIFEPRYLKMVGRCVRDKMPFGVVLITKGSAEQSGAEFRQIGTTARIMQVQRFEDGRLNVASVGEQRFRILETNTAEPYMQGKVQVIPEQPGDGSALDALHSRALDLLSTYLELVTGSDQLRANLEEKDFSPQSLSYTIGTLLQIDLQLKQGILEVPSTTARLEHEISLLRAELVELKLVGQTHRQDVSPPAFWSLN